MNDAYVAIFRTVSPQLIKPTMTILHWKYWRQKAFLLSVYGLLQAIRLGLWANQFQRLTVLSHYLAQRLKQTRLFEPVSVSQILKAVHLTSRYSPGTVKCLARAIATHFLLESAGYPSRLKIGVLKTEGKTLEAHAWVEHRGSVVMGQVEQLTDFIPLQSGSPQ